MWSGSENKVVTDLADCRQYCAEGVAEAEACGDVEMQAEFFFQAALLNIMEGKRLENTLLILQVGLLYWRNYLYMYNMYLESQKEHNVIVVYDLKFCQTKSIN